MLPKLTALQTVNNRIHAGVKHDQSWSDCVMDSNQRNGSSEAQKVNQQLGNPTQDIDDCHANYHLGNAFSVTFQSFLSIFPDVILSEPKVVNHSGIEDSHDAYGDNTSNHWPPNRVEVPVYWLGPAVRAAFELLDVCHSNEAGNCPKSREWPACHNKDCNLGFCEFTFLAVWV